MNSSDTTIVKSLINTTYLEREWQWGILDGSAVS